MAIMACCNNWSLTVSLAVLNGMHCEARECALQNQNEPEY